MKNRKLFSSLLLILIMIPLGAQTVRAGMESTTVYVGQSVIYTIQISGSEAVDRPELWGFTDFSIKEAGESRGVNTTLINGRASRQVVSEFKWELTPLKTGEIPVPSVQVEVDGAKLSTREGQLQVKKPGKMEGYKLFLTVDSQRVFPGMPVRLSLKWLISSGVSSPEFHLPFLDNPELEIRNVPAPSSGSHDIHELDINGETVYAMQSSEIFEGRQYTSLTIFWDLYPVKTGTIDISGVLLSFKRATRRDRWGGYTYENAAIPGNSLSFLVEEVPAELARFSGGVFVSKGPLDMDLTLDQTKVYPGDPVTLKGEFRNLSNADVMDFKGFGSIPELQDLFKIDRTSLITGSEEGVLSFSQTIRPLSETTGEFPSFRIPYYNQQNGKVEVFISDPLKLEVLALKKNTGSLTDNSSETEAVIIGDENKALVLHHNLSMDSMKTVPELFLPPIVFLLSPVLMYLFIHGGVFFYKRHSRSLLEKMGGKAKSFGHLKKEMDSLQKNPTLDRLREFNAYLLSWLNREYNGLVGENLKVDPNAADKYFHTTGTDDLEELLRELNSLCWSGQETNNLAEPLGRIADKFSGKRAILL